MCVVEADDIRAPVEGGLRSGVPGPADSLGLIVPDEAKGAITTSAYIANADALYCPADKSMSERPRGELFYKGGATGYAMSYWYIYFTPFSYLPRPVLAKSHRYRIGKSPGDATIVTDQGSWAYDVTSPYYTIYAAIHKDGYNVLHINGAVNWIKQNQFEDAYFDEIAKTKYPSYTGDWHWNPRLAVLDRL